MAASAARQRDADGRRTIRFFLPASLAGFHAPPWTLPPLRRNEAALPAAPSQPAFPPARSRP